MRQQIVFLTGAGVSAESGLSTFRGKDGMWTNEEWVHLASTDALYNETQNIWRIMTKKVGTKVCLIRNKY